MSLPLSSEGSEDEQKNTWTIRKDIGLYTNHENTQMYRQAFLSIKKSEA